MDHQSPKENIKDDDDNSNNIDENSKEIDCKSNEEINIEIKSEDMDQNANDDRKSMEEEEENNDDGNDNNKDKDNKKNDNKDVDDYVDEDIDIDTDLTDEPCELGDNINIDYIDYQKNTKKDSMTIESDSELPENITLLPSKADQAAFADLYDPQMIVQKRRRCIDCSIL